MIHQSLAGGIIGVKGAKIKELREVRHYFALFCSLLDFIIFYAELVFALFPMIDNPIAIYLGLKVTKLSCFVQLISFLGLVCLTTFFMGIIGFICLK